MKFKSVRHGFYSWIGHSDALKFLCDPPTDRFDLLSAVEEACKKAYICGVRHARHGEHRAITKPKGSR